MSQQFKSAIREEAGECAFCGISDDAHQAEYGESLHVHRLIPNRAGGEYERGNVVVVCTNCHDTIERTQARALSKLQSETEPDPDSIAEVEEQRDALLRRVETLERAIRDPTFYSDVVDRPTALGEVVTTRIGDKMIATDDPDRAREAYEDWGTALRRVSFHADNESVEREVQKRLDQKYGIEGILEEARRR
jgi:hypothetical protein